MAVFWQSTAPATKISVMNDYSIRQVAVGDAAVAAHHRTRMFQDMGEVPQHLVDDLRRSSELMLAALLASGEYIGWFALDGAGTVIAGAGVHIKAHLPRIALHGGGVADSSVPLVVNVYTEPEWRGRGIARALMEKVLDWADGLGYERVVLHASDAARPLYKSLGFAATNEMRWMPRRRG